jgi:hypothetical protein
VTLASEGRVTEHEGNREIARTVGPPRLDPEPGLCGLELELLAAELRADLNSERLIIGAAEAAIPPATIELKLTASVVDAVEDITGRIKGISNSAEPRSRSSVVRPGPAP